MPVKRLLIGDAPVVAWSLQEALGPLLPIPVHALAAPLAFPPEAPDAFLLIEILLPGGGCGLTEAMHFRQGVGGGGGGGDGGGPSPLVCLGRLGASPGWLSG